MYLKMTKTQFTDNQNNKKMKTKIITLSVLLIATLGLTKSANAATANSATAIVLSNITTISKIEVHGNVELFISDGSADQVKVYNKYYSENALVQSTNGVLRITSYQPEKLVVWVTANDLRSVSAYDNAEVQSFGSLSKIDFNVDLHNNASAKLDLNAYNANVTVADHAKADLSGNADELTLNHNYAASVNDFHFAAGRLTDNKIGFPVQANNDMAGIL
jgi:hypothetical protein